MKFMKLFSSAAAACLLAGASAAAMARNDCPGGSIIGGEFDEIVINEWVDCVMIGPIVGSGGIRAISARYITITHAQVEGPVRVIRDVVTDASTAVIANNLVNGGFSIVVRDLDEADVRWNRVTEPPDGQAGTGSDIGVIDTASLGTLQDAHLTDIGA